MDTVLEELQCPVCLELFQTPTILPCSHILCRTPCAERLFEDGFVRCPVCRDRSFVTGGVESLPKVLSLENIIERYRTQGSVTPVLDEGEECGADDIPCQLCEKSPRKAKKSCLDCNASYCQKCLRLSHPYKEPFSRHQLVEPRRYPKPVELRCPHHDMRVNVYCGDCQQLGCVLCSDDKDGHEGHRILSLDQAAEQLRRSLEVGVAKIEKCREAYTESSATLQEKKTTLENKVSERRSQVHQQCNLLVRELELKREFFLLDLDHEKKLKMDLISKQMSEYVNSGLTLQGLQHFAQEALKEKDTCAFIQYAQKASDSIGKSLLTSEDLSSMSPTVSLSQKIVDLRRERALLRGIEYLNVPAKPVIAVSKCSRSTSSVVLVLSPPRYEHDVIDGYQIYFCSEVEKKIGDQHSVVFRTNQEGRWSFRQQSEQYSVCVIEEHLHPDTLYYFCVQAFNEAGASEMSDIITCHTLKDMHAQLKVPEMNLENSRTYTFSIQIYCANPAEYEPESGFTHYLLYRESRPDNLWKSLRMYPRTNHSVFGLEADVLYDFVVMAYHRDGESLLSESVSLKTERDT